MKKFLLLILSLAIIFTGSACSKPSENGGEVQQNKPTTTAPPEPEKIISQEVTFYFPDDAVMYLVPDVMTVDAYESEFLEGIVQTIIKGPSGEDLKPSITGDVEVLSVTVDDGICTVDLSSEFAEYNTGGTTRETMAIYSIVNTLCGLDNIDKVKINIEGDENADFGGHFSLNEPFEPDLSMIQK